jgi:hypothetical protein
MNPEEKLALAVVDLAVMDLKNGLGKKPSTKRILERESARNFLVNLGDTFWGEFLSGYLNIPEIEKWAREQKV